MYSCRYYRDCAPPVEALHCAEGKCMLRFSLWNVAASLDSWPCYYSCWSSGICDCIIADRLTVDSFCGTRSIIFLCLIGRTWTFMHWYPIELFIASATPRCLSVAITAVPSPESRASVFSLYFQLLCRRIVPIHLCQ